MNYRGKSYSEWISDWLNWFLSANPDKRNSGPVVFLTSKHIPQNTSHADVSNGMNQSLAVIDSLGSENIGPQLS